jgi:branched-subunit amino acid ABC-type transport system permease component
MCAISTVTTRVNDSNANGFYVGAAIGALAGVLSAANFSGEYRPEDLAGVRALVALAQGVGPRSRGGTWSC